MAMASKVELVTNMEDVRSIVEEMGKRLVHITDINNQRDTLNNDPNVVSVLEIGKKFKYQTVIDDVCDAFIGCNNVGFPMNWNEYSRTSLRKRLSSGDDSLECLVCFEEIEKLDTWHCRRCNATMCPVCFVKIVLTAREDFAIRPFRCPECRSKLIDNVLQFYVKVMDRLSEFEPSHQNALLCIKRHSPTFDVLLSEWKRQRISQDSIIVQRKAKAPGEISRQLKPGCAVKLHGLKKKNWNGRTAVIIGKKEMKNGVVRWPIQLKRKCRSKALLKECNMKKK